MSFLRHREIYRSDGLGFRESGARSGGLHAPTHRFDEFPAGYSLAGCAPAEPASASPAEQKFTMKAIPRPSFFSANGETLLSRLSHFRGPPRMSSFPTRRTCCANCVRLWRVCNR